MATYSIFTFKVAHIHCYTLTMRYSIYLTAHASINACYTVTLLLRVSASEYCSIQLFVVVQTPAHNTAMLLPSNEGGCNVMEVCLQLSTKLLRHVKYM